jgi:lipoprotein-anchoring transpeptidase ErfK/SrfK
VVNPLAFPQLTLITQGVHADASRGIQLQFNAPVKSLKWVWQGETHVLELATPAKQVWVPVHPGQGAPYHLTIEGARGPVVKPLVQAVDLQGSIPPPLGVATVPGIGQYNVLRSGPFRLQFSAAMVKASLASAVSFTPAVSGMWTWTSPQQAQFVPNQPLPPAQYETMTVQGGPGGPRSVQGQYLATNIVRPFFTQSTDQIVITETLPETLTLYQNGNVILKALCNTGVTQATTPTGTYYIQSKFPWVNMKGTDPNGQTYDIPHVPWVMGLFGDFAIHGYPRATYGFPQSNGCIELPPKTARALYNLVPVGTQVRIQP